MIREIEKLRIRRPREFDDLFKELTGKLPYRESESPFVYMYDVLVFAASLGLKLNLREPFSQTDEPIMYGQMKSNRNFETIVAAISVLNNGGDHTCLSAERAEERIMLFEEYACGGLRFMAEALDEYVGTPRVFIESLVSQHLDSDFE